MSLFQTVTNPIADADVLRRRRYGVIVVRDERLHSIRLRPYPRIASVVESQLWGEFQHQRSAGNWCRLYYNQPISAPNYLAATYAISSRGCTMGSIRLVVRLIDEIARLKRSDAALCDVIGSRISARLLARWGWEPHAESRWHRNFIRRYYGEYPPPLAGWSLEPAAADRQAGGHLPTRSCPRGD